MAFNSNTYHANRYRRIAREELALARDIKARAMVGDAYDWEVARIPGLAQRAILSARLARTHDRLNALKR